MPTTLAARTTARTTLPTSGTLTLRGLLPREPKAAEQPAPPAQPAAPAPRPTPPSVLLLAQLRERWPNLFAGGEVRPLAIGIHKAIRAAMPDVAADVLGSALSWHTGSGAYRDAILTVGHPRYGLDGEPCGEVTQEQVERLQASRARDAQKRHQRFLEQHQT